MARPDSSSSTVQERLQQTDTRPLLRELVTHLAQSRTQLREEWARRITEAQLLTAMTQGEIFAEATAVYDNYVETLETPLKIETAKRAEEAALSADPRIFNSEGASFDNHVGRHIFANSRGFAASFEASAAWAF